MNDRMVADTQPRATTWRKAGLLVVAIFALAVALRPGAAAAQPELVQADPADGAQLDRPPETVHLCFSESIVREAGDAWRFNLAMPNGRILGIRVEFSDEDKCVDIFPGIPQDAPAGQWTLDWRVRGQETGEDASGSLSFQVTEGGTPAPEATLAPPIVPSPVPSPAVPAQDSGGGVGISDLLLALIIGLGAAAVVFVAGLVIMRLRGANGRGS